MDHTRLLSFGELAAVIILVASSVLTAYALAAARARRLPTSSRAVRLANRGSAAIMAGTALTITAPLTPKP